MVKYIVYLTLVLILVNAPTCVYAGHLNCTTEEQLVAEKASETAHDWDSLYHAYRQFENCDDGGTSEGFSDTVMKLLAKNWQSSLRLQILVLRDDGFETFILNHINATADISDIKEIQENAQYHCSAKAEKMCKSIISRTRDVINTKP